MNYNPAFTWPIAFATNAVVLAVALAVARRRRRRARTAPRTPARLSRPPAVQAEAASDQPAFDSIYHVSPAPDGEGGENT